MLRNTTISAKVLVLTGFLLSFLIYYLYAHSVTIVYGVVELLIAAVCYIGCLRWHCLVDGNSLVLWCGTVVLTWCSGLFSGDFKSTLLITVPLLMPLYISTLNITYKNWSDFAPATIAAVAITYLMVGVGAFGEINSNTAGFLGFMGVSIGALWIKNTKHKLIPAAWVLFGFYYAISSGSRNVAIVGLIWLVLIFLPKSVFRKPLVYYSICVAVLLYSVIAVDVLKWFFSKPKIQQFLEEYTARYSDKAWEMSTRIEFLEMLQRFIGRRSLSVQMFGTGTFMFHGHNLFFQCVLNYGYIGTVLIYAGFIRIFRVAYYLVAKKDDVTLGCVVILWGMFLLQGADVFMLGHETYAVVPQVIMGIVLNRHGVYRVENEAKNRIELQLQTM